MLIEKHGRGRRIEETRPSRESPRHLAWIRGHYCVVAGCKGRRTQAHHVRSALTSGTSMKPPDSATIPLCFPHHGELHQIGADSFQTRYNLNLIELAQHYASKSPHLG